MIVDARMVHRARTELFETGSVSEPMTRAVRPDILASWRRSAAFGAKPDVITLPYHEDNGVGERLLDAAAPVLRALADSLAGLHAGVLLADREANIVERWVADAAILGELDRICSDAGFSAPEDRVGTNGIGTVAELGRAQLVIGPEHFADALTSFTCVGAPIRNPTTRRLEGIVTLSCRADAGNALLTPLMVSTASDIEHRLLQAVTVDERRMLDAYLGAKRRHHLVAAVGRDLLIAGARATHVLEDLVERDVLWELVSDLLAGAGPMVRTVAAGSTREVGLTLTPVLDDGRLVGAIVDIDDAHDGDVQRRRGATPTRAIDLPGESVTWLAAMRAALRYAESRVPLVVTGEPGVGKSSLARAVVACHPTMTPPVELDCRDLAAGDALPPAAEAVVLRHLESLSEETTRTLLSWLQRGPSRPWLVATLSTGGRDLSDAHQRIVGELGAVTLRLPALHERPEDIAVIARHVVATDPHSHAVRLSADAVAELGRASWPDNARQLSNLVRSLIGGRVGEITAADLPAEIRSRSTRRVLTPIERLECEAIVQALSAADGNKVVAARTIGLSRSTIYRKLRAYGLDQGSTFF
jgi:transcriptional regulator of acetoin/glycerol metabolism